MTTAALGRPPARPAVPRAILIAIGVGWALAVAAELSGSAHSLHHDSLIHHGPPLWQALPLFLVAWQAMVAAMMLPSALPLTRMFDAVSRGQEHAGRARAAFLGAYFVVWTGFGAQAFLGDMGVHQLVDSWGWLHAHQFVVAGTTLAIAGAFQFSELKEQCLSKCRQPGPYMLANYRRGPSAAFRLGLGHGLYCLGCCWALMLVMFAAGVATLWWMAALTAVMVYEKTGRHGEAVTPAVGVTLLALSPLAFAHLPWLSVLSG